MKCQNCKKEIKDVAYINNKIVCQLCFSRLKRRNKFTKRDSKLWTQWLEIQESTK